MEIEQIFPEIRLDLPEIIVACDVRNRLLGKDGSTRVYGEQKGITTRYPSIWKQLYRIADNISFGDESFDLMPTVTRGTALLMGELYYC